MLEKRVQMGLVEGKVMWEAMAIPETAEGKEIRV